VPAPGPDTYEAFIQVVARIQLVPGPKPVAPRPLDQIPREVAGRSWRGLPVLPTCA